ncbi:MAG: aminoglycoside phosphotransferase (APT) family kinase protein [Kiritimatiellia bacterium]|jgi:aminoglycoside phosphotransferase (APT) family kinase protein
MELDRTRLAAAMHDLVSHAPHLPDLSAARVHTDRLGMREYAGASAVVYKVHGDAGTWALRFADGDGDKMVTHHQLVLKHLGARPALRTLFPWFEARSQGLWMADRGTWLPMVRMDWVQGRSLLAEVEHRLGDSVALRALADSLLHLLDTLHQHMLTHGDLQPDNLVVQADGQVLLFDLDDVVVDSIVGEPWATGGFVGYAHPSRATSAERCHGVDLFPGLVMLLGIYGLAHDPDLWERVDLFDTGSLLCTEQDYATPWNSRRFRLLELVNDEMADLVRKIRLLAGLDLTLLGKLGRPSRVVAPGLRGRLARLAGGW